MRLHHKSFNAIYIESGEQVFVNGVYHIVPEQVSAETNVYWILIVYYDLAKDAGKSDEGLNECLFIKIAGSKSFVCDSLGNKQYQTPFLKWLKKYVVKDFKKLGTQ